MGSALKALIATSLIVVAVAAGVASGTLATFTSQTINPGNVESNATLAMKNVAGTAVSGSNCTTETTSGTCATLFNVQNLLPGGSSSNTATITYTGTVSTGDFRLFMANFNEFASGYNATLCTNAHPGQQIGLQIKQGTGVIYPTSGSGFGSLYDFAVTSAYATSSTGLRLKPGANGDTGAVGTWPAANPAVTFTVNLQMDSAADNTNQGCRSSFDLDWYATQNGPLSWSNAGGLTTPRLYFTMTLLQNGMVLLAGGVTNGCAQTLNTAELFNPVTRTWSPTGSMSTPRAEHTATLLANGKVLVAGGIYHCGQAGAANASAELFDPATGAWSLAGTMSVPREGHAAIRLGNGKVLVSGGDPYVSGEYTSAELYDPSSNSWSATGSMAYPRRSASLVGLQSGKIIMTGGFGANVLNGSSELYDPATGTWSLTGSLVTPRSSYGATLVNGGKVLVVGGVGPSGGLASAELYDPTAGTWASTGSMSSPRYYFGSEHQDDAVILPDGRVLVAGGFFEGPGPAGTTYASAEVYDPLAGTWASAPSLSGPRQFHRSVRLSDGRVLVAGGIVTSSGPTAATSEIFGQ